MNIDDLYAEIQVYISTLDFSEDGEHLWSRYQEATSIAVRLTEIHNQIAFMELKGEATMELKKFRTTILDPTIDRFEKVAAYESRKITARQIEANLER